MANNVTAQILGEDPRVLDDVFTVADIKLELGVANESETGELSGDTYSASVNGEPTLNNFELSDYENVTLSPSVKGG